MSKFVYFFDEGRRLASQSDPNAERNMLGGKGAGLAEMTAAGLPVPSGFTITTSQETFLGPGQRGGALQPQTSTIDGHTTTLGYDHMPTKQRGPALVATLYDTGGNPIAIAHDVVAVDMLQVGGI